jgi:hypothetical protein
MGHACSLANINVYCQEPGEKRLTDLSVLGVSVDSKPSSWAFTMTLKLSLDIPER